MIAGFSPFYHEEPMKLYENILVCKPKFSASFDPYCKELVKKLLVVDLSKRYGNLKGGVKDIKTHKWFSGIEWNKLESVAPPYVPHVKGPGDASQFDMYSEDYEPYGTVGKDPFSELFKGF